MMLGKKILFENFNILMEEKHFIIILICGGGERGGNLGGRLWGNRNSYQNLKSQNSINRHVASLHNSPHENPQTFPEPKIASHRRNWQKSVLMFIFSEISRII